MKFLVDNYLDGYNTITANDEDQYNPVTNIEVKTLADYWQTASAGTKTVNITLDAVKTVNEIVLEYHNLVAGDIVSISSYPDADGFGGIAITESLIVRTGTIYLKTSALHSNTRYYKLTIVKNSGSYVRLGFLFIGQCDFEAPHKAYGLPEIKNNFVISPSSGFQVYTNNGQAVSVHSFDCVGTQTAFELADILAREYIGICGICLPTFENLDYKEPFFGYIESVSFARSYSGRYFFNFVIVEGK